MTAEDCAIGFRVDNILKKLKIPEEKIEEFLTIVFELSQKRDMSSEILREALIEFAQISYKIPFSEIPINLQKMREKIVETENRNRKLEEETQKLEKEILAKEEQVRIVLREKNTTLFHINNFIETKCNLAKFGIVVEDIDKFTRCVEGIARYANFDPFKVIQKFSDLHALEKEVENKQKIINDLDINIQKLKEKESEYDDRLDLKSLKLKSLEELEKTGLTNQELKKLNMILFEIAVEHKITNKEHIKAKFFELFEKLEDRITLESKNGSMIKTSHILENKIRIDRQTLHCQEVVGPILKNLFEKGITEVEIVAVKALVDILLYNSSTTGNDIAKTDVKYENFSNLSINNNDNSDWREDYEKFKWAIDLFIILNLVDLNKNQYIKERFRFSCPTFPTISSYKHSDFDDRKQEGIADTIIEDNDIIGDSTIYINSLGWSFLTK